MRNVGRGHAHRDVPHLTRVVLSLTLAGALLASCSSQESTDRTADRDPAGTRSPAPSATTGSPAPAPARRATPDHVQPVLPTEPARAAAALADQLDRTAAALRDPDSTATRVRRAGRFQQLAVHRLATGPDAFRRRVTARLNPRTAALTRGAVRAATSLHAITSPQPTLPDWRIVAPPPPQQLRAYYRRAQRRTGVPWAYLAAIHLVETRMGRIRGTSTAGAVGPMQFIPSTWQLYGRGGDITDARDAILAAARLLRDNGAPGDMRAALWHYNPSDNYVRAVAAHARAMQRSEAAYRGYWHWRVLYRHRRGTYVLPVGYPQQRPVPLPER